ncbi:DUF1127 domain-containing protein [Marivivens donghaensis]|uniref:DUF1127 domain-containing protein n=1 Tax=Marivivens donghaensis TaxID=1699413 RepID=UPI000CF6BF3B|nr:DUF1127 domain-containing protein [Marivivens donghaensis]MCL7407766.1 DUF1127 domain-containing protein [Marivivens donghaensis]MDN3704255.1 DUF1127 domain-containing protein [Marivivens donghaensis]
MAMVDTTTAYTPRLAYQAVSFVYNVITSIQLWNESRKTVSVLEKLTDRELNDIGLNRGDIYNFARTGSF